MTHKQRSALCIEIWPDMKRLADYGDATENYDSLCRVLEDLNAMLTSREWPPFACDFLEFYRQVTTPRTPTRH